MLIQIRGREKHVGLGWKPGRGTRPEDFRASAVLPRKMPADVTLKRWWANGWWGDQGNTSQCVIYSWLHGIHDGPVTPKHRSKLRFMKPIVDPTVAYVEGQNIDGTDPSDTESGLTCNAGAQVFLRRKMIGEYRWGETAEEVINWLLLVGPVMRGSNWYWDDFEPASTGLLTMTGGVAGGHQTKGDAADKVEELAWFKNSWSRTWGGARTTHPSGKAQRGFYCMTFDQIENDIKNEGAEYCMYRELPTTERIIA